MRPRHPALPRLWLMTDERLGEALWAALERLPRGGGIVFRHHGLPRSERRALFERIRKLSRRKHLVLILASSSAETARAWRADGRHGPGPDGTTALRTASAHNLHELKQAERGGAQLLFVSPVFATRSHPGGRVLGRVRFGLIARHASVPVVALGGMSASRARHLSGAYGWAAIDAWAAEPGQKRKAVPR